MYIRQVRLCASPAHIRGRSRQSKKKTKPNETKPTRKNSRCYRSRCFLKPTLQQSKAVLVSCEILDLKQLKNNE